MSVHVTQMPHKIWHMEFIPQECFFKIVEIRRVLLAVLAEIPHQMRLPMLVEIEAGGGPLPLPRLGPAGEAGADGGARHPGHHRAQGTPAGLLQGGVVPLLLHDVQGPVEERPPAGAGHGKLVDGGIGVTLGLQLRLGDAATPRDES